MSPKGHQNEHKREPREQKERQWDSLGHVNLLIALEKEYNIAIDYEMLTKLVSISAIIQFLKDNVHVG